jgi:hypothetical protein
MNGPNSGPSAPLGEGDRHSALPHSIARVRPCFFRGLSENDDPNEVDHTSHE